MMASPVQLIYSCYFPPEQTNTCRLDGWERESGMIFLYSLFSPSIYLHYLFLLLFFLFLSISLSETHTHTHTLWQSGVIGMVLVDKTKGLWLLYNCFDPYQGHDVYSVCCVTPPSSPASPPPSFSWNLITINKPIYMYWLWAYVYTYIYITERERDQALQWRHTSPLT